MPERQIAECLSTTRREVNNQRLRLLKHSKRYLFTAGIGKGNSRGKIGRLYFKIADMMMRWKIARLLTYHTAHLWDLGWDITMESNVAKVFNCEGVLGSSLDGIQVMGGDGLTPFYPLATIMQVAKVEHIAGGTMEACRMVIQRTGLRQLADELKMPRRIIHEKLGVPIPTGDLPVKEKAANEEKVLRFWQRITG